MSGDDKSVTNHGGCSINTYLKRTVDKKSEENELCSQTTVAKSFDNGGRDPIIQYCTRFTVKQDPIEKELYESTLKNSEYSIMLGAPEVLQFGKNMIRLIGGKRILDIGTYTGASALAWALAIPNDGEVVTMDTCHDELDKIGMPILRSKPEVFEKIKFELGPAVQILDNLLQKGEKRKFDFAFIDADKPNYSNYYKKCMELLRPGGVIFVDNALWDGKVAKDPTTFDAWTNAIHECNFLISNDPESNSALINMGDGLYVVFKK